MVPESEGCSLLNQNKAVDEFVKVSGTKRQQPECLTNSPHQQTPIRNNRWHLVYVRRKPESTQHKNRTCNTSKDLPVELCEQDGKNHEQSPMKDSRIHIPKAVPEPEISTEMVSSAIPSVTIDSGKSNTTSIVAESRCCQLDYPKRSSVQHWEERFFLLQNFLKVLDQPAQDDYNHMLRSLSSVDLSRLAVELEWRTIQLSSEEVGTCSERSPTCESSECPRNTRVQNVRRHALGRVNSASELVPHCIIAVYIVCGFIYLRLCLGYC